MEDLTTIRNGNVVSVAQVKAHSEPLTLSALRPDKLDSFLYRSARLVAKNSGVRIKLVTFGEVGPELRGALLEGGSDLERLTGKLENYGFLTKVQANELLKKVELEFVNEQEIVNTILRTLKSTMTVGDYSAALDILQKWLLDCAENSTRISRRQVLETLSAVGRFVSERAAHHLEWFASIHPIEDRTISSSEIVPLETEFYGGIATRYEHVLASLDVERPLKLQQLHEAFRTSRVVFLHGASGQGKSTLAYRFLHDTFPDYCRLEISVIDGTSHALRIASAIREQAGALNLPLCVFIDVAPGSQGWTDLVLQLSRLSNVQTLVAIREEDLRRADLPRHQVSCQSISLDMDEAEARQIFLMFSDTVGYRFFLSFEEAWVRFGGAGPLLEFVHLITQGDSLGSRLSQQVNKLRDFVRLGQMTPEELSLLRLVSVAGAAGARLNLSAVTEALFLPEPRRTIEILEKEYLVRVTGGNTLEGLHPVRSAILADLLTNSSFPSWRDSAALCIALCDEVTLGSFLFHVFSQNGDLEPLYKAIQAFSPRTWTGLSSCLQGVLWWGLRTYVQENMSLFQEIYDRCGSGWSVVVDFDIADANPGSADAVLTTMSGMVSEQGAADMRDFRSRQTDKTRVFQPSRQWLATRTKLPPAPSNESEWAALAHAFFWTKRLGLADLWSDYALGLRLDDAAMQLSLVTGADLCYSLYDCGNPQWEHLRGMVGSRFRDQFTVSAIEDDGHEVKAHFLLDPSSLGIQKPHDVAMGVVDLLAKLWPDRSSFACQGYGLSSGLADLPYDETKKNISVSRMLAPQLTAVNATFRNLVELSFRPKDWPSYATEIVALREGALRLADEIIKYLIRYFQSRTLVTADSVIESQLWGLTEDRLLRRPLLPVVAFKPMSGFSQESGEEDRYKPWQKAEGEFFGRLSNFVKQARDVLLLHPHLGRARSSTQKSAVLAAASKLGLNAGFSFLSTHNLTDAMLSMDSMQSEFSTILNPVLKEEARDLGLREHEKWGSLWHLWFHFASTPERQWSDPMRRALSESNAMSNTLFARIDSAVRPLSRTGCKVTRLNVEATWNHESVLWFVVNTDDPATALTAVGPVLSALLPVFTVEGPMEKLMRRSQWSHVALIPIVEGKTLMRHFWRLPLITLQQSDSIHSLGVWNFVQQEIPPETWDELSLGCEEAQWPAKPLAFARSYSDLLSSASYLREVVILADREDSNDSKLQSKALVSMSEVLSAATKVVASLEALVNEFHRARKNDLPERPILSWVVENVVEFFKPFRQAAWINTGVLPLPIQVARWSENVDALQTLAGVIYVGWMTDSFLQDRNSGAVDTEAALGRDE